MNWALIYMFYSHSKNTRKKVLKFGITGYWHPRTRLTKEGRNCYIGNYLKRSNSFWCSKFESFLHVVFWFSFIPSFFLCCGCSPITQHLLRFSFYRRSWIVQHHRNICNSVSLDLLAWTIKTMWRCCEPPPPPTPLMCRERNLSNSDDICLFPTTSYLLY